PWPGDGARESPSWLASRKVCEDDLVLIVACDPRGFQPACDAARGGIQPGAVPFARRLPYAFLTAAIVGAGFVARRLAVRLTPGYVPHHDDRSYLLHVLALERTGSYPVFHHGIHTIQTAYRPPGLPYLLAGVHWLFG